MDSRLESFLRRKLRSVGREFEAARRAYHEGRTDEGGASADATGAETDAGGSGADAPDDRPTSAAGTAETTGPHPSLPRDDDGAVPLVCRRHAERRAVRVDEGGRPACFDADHPDCRGCAEDVREGTVETW